MGGKFKRNLSSFTMYAMRGVGEEIWNWWVEDTPKLLRDLKEKFIIIASYLIQSLFVLAIKRTLN